MTVKTIECSGSDYPMGVLQGRLLKDQINEFWKQLENSRQLEFVKPKLLPKSVHLLHCQKKADTFLKNYLQKVMPEQGERIHGISQGSGLPSETLYFLQALEMELLTKPDTFAITSGLGIFVNKEKSLNNSVMLGFNYDYAFDLTDKVVVRRSRPRNQYQSVDITLAFLAGSLGGINETGLTVMLVPGYANDGISLKTIPITILIQKVLESCRTIPEALNILKAHNKDIGGTLLLVDSGNNHQIVWFSRGKLIEAKASTSYEVFTSQLEMLQDHTFSPTANWSNKAWDPFKGLSIFESSSRRKAQALSFSKDSLIDLEELDQVLLDQQDKGENSIWRQGDIITTQFSVLLSPRDRKILIRHSPNKEDAQKEFNI